MMLVFLDSIDSHSGKRFQTDTVVDCRTCGANKSINEIGVSKVD